MIVPILQKRKLSFWEVNLSFSVSHMVTKCGAWSKTRPAAVGKWIHLIPLWLSTWLLCLRSIISWTFLF